MNLARGRQVLPCIMFNYYDSWRTDEFDCPDCKWHGTGVSLAQGELTGDYFELLCPTCGECVTVVMNPTIEESRANMDKLSDVDRKQVELIAKLQADFEHQKLRESTPLPAINASSFVLHWDFLYARLDSETLIKYDDAIIFREPVIYEGYERFIEVAKLLRARYGSALRDLIPTQQSWTYLYGDRLSAPRIIEEARKEIFAPS